METPTTKARGRKAATGFIAETAGIELRMAWKRKYKFAALLNY